MEFFLLFLVGLGTGVIGAITGTGGGIILAPILLIFFGLEPALGAGTTLALVSINSTSGAIMYLREKLVDKRSGLIFALAATPGAILAPFAVKQVSGDIFRVLFGLLLVSIAIYLFYRSLRPSNASLKKTSTVTFTVKQRQINTGTEIYKYEFNESLGAMFNFFLGFVSAFFGTGGGFVRTPILVTAFGFPVKVAVATSIFALSIYATIGAAVHVYLGHTEWMPTFIATAPGLIIGSLLGVYLSKRIRNIWTIILLAILLLIMGAQLVSTGAAQRFV